MYYCSECSSRNIETLTDEFNMPITLLCLDCGSERIGDTEEEEWDSYFE